MMRLWERSDHCSSNCWHPGLGTCQEGPQSPAWPTNQVHWPLLGKLLFLKSLQMVLKGNMIDTDSAATANWTKRKAFLGAWDFWLPQLGLEVRGIPEYGVTYPLPDISRARRGHHSGLNTGESNQMHETPQIFNLYHVLGHGLAWQKSKMKTKAFCFPH